MRYAYFILPYMMLYMLTSCNYGHKPLLGTEEKQSEKNSNHKKERANPMEEVPRESERLLLMLSTTDEYGYTARYKYTYDFDSCMMTVKPSPESSKYYKEVKKYKITPNQSIEYIDYRNCPMKLSINNGLITEISEEWDKDNTLFVNYVDRSLTKLYRKETKVDRDKYCEEANWDREKLNQVKTTFYYGPYINDWVSYKIARYTGNYVKSSPNLLQEMFGIHETEIVFIYIGLYGKLPKTTSRYTIDTYREDAYVYTTIWLNNGNRLIVKKQKVGSERFSEVCYDWEIENIDLFKTMFNRHEDS